MKGHKPSAPWNLLTTLPVPAPANSGAPTRPKWAGAKEVLSPSSSQTRSASLSSFHRWLKWDPGEGNGNPLQYSWSENSMDRGAWQATVHGVAKSQTWLSMHACKIRPRKGSFWNSIFLGRPYALPSGRPEALWNKKWPESHSKLRESWEEHSLLCCQESMDLREISLDLGA